MITNKYITTIIVIITVIAVCLCLCAAAFADIQTTGVAMEYESALFDTDEALTVCIKMDEDDMNEMLENTASGDWYKCDVIINGTTIGNVGIRASYDTEGYSFTLVFDKYEKGETCFGLDTLVLKYPADTDEALVYDMCEYLGADAPLYNYATIELNGEAFGEYLAVEGVDDSFMLRNYGIARGELYELDSRDGDVLSYTDDELDSYTVIWENATSKTSKKDRKQVVAALKSIAEGDDTEDYLYVDNVLRYMAVHTFVSRLTGNSLYSYYLYEHSGMLNLIPSDYDFSTGGSMTDFVSSDIFAELLENEEYLARYNDYLSLLEAEYSDLTA